jgi:hypothetical protein
MFGNAFPAEQTSPEEVPRQSGTVTVQMSGNISENGR